FENGSVNNDFENSDFENHGLENHGSEAKAAQPATEPASSTPSPLDRRHFLVAAAVGAAAMALPRWARAESVFSPNLGPAAFDAALFDDALSAIRAEVAKRHNETVQRLQTWIKQPSIAAENRGM